MPIVGITGGIASGKSTFGRLVRERLQAEFFDTDECSRELLNNDAEVRGEILQRVDPQAYLPDGRPDRIFLRDLVFREADKRRALEEILHPRIRAAWRGPAERARAVGMFYLVDIPLLFETGAAELFDRIVTVACSVSVQLTRLVTTRNLTREISEKIVASQMPMGVKIASSHHVVWNEGSIETLTTQTDFLARHLHDRSGEFTRPCCRP